MNEGSVDQGQLAPITSRFLALLLDACVVFIPSIVLGHIFPVIGNLLVAFFYFPILECSRLKGTLGKYFLKIQVVDLQRRQLTFRTALIRNFIKIFSGALFCVGYMVAFFTQKRQALHDLLAETLVVSGFEEHSISDAWSDSVKGVFSSMSLPGHGGSRSSLADLERLQALREKGAITEEEFKAEKRRILKR